MYGREERRSELYLHQLSEVEFRSLENFDFTDKHVLQRVDARRCLLDLPSDHLGDKLVDQLLQITGSGLVDHDFPHLATDLNNVQKSRTKCEKSSLDTQP